MPSHVIRVGCAGWSIPKKHAEHFPEAGSHLVRYAQRFPAVEVNSSFYQPHRPSTYARWAGKTPEGFAFAPKVPKEVTHERRLIDAGEPLDRFLAETAALGAKRSPKDREVARVAADPAVVPVAAEPGGWGGLVYHRLHGSQKVYYSAYAASYLDPLAGRIAGAVDAAPVWCIFDNTVIGAATADALAVLIHKPADAVRIAEAFRQESGPIVLQETDSISGLVYEMAQAS